MSRNLEPFAIRERALVRGVITTRIIERLERTFLGWGYLAPRAVTRSVMVRQLDPTHFKAFADIESWTTGDRSTYTYGITKRQKLSTKLKGAMPLIDDESGGRKKGAIFIIEFEGRKPA